ncbi:VOC family protein [Aureibacillus halotolerans]|uniref:VOC domain-containing protein n=1 Tax=Aureibacillus halotolerans TaxID=1508390 RepID=A0A4R6U3T7_9BACI|nr:VOC family protein [Aureibacillus halotolerans]TDQ40711.1 hypothetical protein EV213_10557 [Aureibacillus halotolerans]
MATDVWINLPVENTQRSKSFFEQLGFDVSVREETGHVILSFGENNSSVMLFPREMFEQFTGQDAADPREASQVLISISAASRDEVNELARNAEAAGGSVYAEPAESQGFMYGCGFADPDGHRWNALYMDPEQMPKA